MPNTIVVSDIDFDNFLTYSDIFSTLSSSSKEEMNAIIIYDSENNSLYFLTEESTSYAHMRVNATIKFEKKEESTQVILGTGVSSDLLFYTLSNYSSEERKEITFTITFGEQGGFLIQRGRDKVYLPCKYLSNSKLDVNFKTLIKDELPEAPTIFQLSLLGDQKNDFLKGLIQSSKFISKDEKKNNAYAIYQDKIIVNDKRHIFIYRFDNLASFIPEETPISLHKTSAKIFMTMASKNLNFDAIMFDNTRVYLYSGDFTAVINNSIANINPPPAKSLLALIPSVQVTNVVAGTLVSMANFFMGFYRGSSEYKPITFEVQKEGIKLLLKDSGISGSASCNVEKLMECDLFEGALEANNSQVSILNDSMISFAKELASTDQIQFFMQRADKEGKKSRAVYLHHPKKSIYLATLD